MITIYQTLDSSFTCNLWHSSTTWSSNCECDIIGRWLPFFLPLVTIFSPVCSKNHLTKLELHWVDNPYQWITLLFFQSCTHCCMVMQCKMMIFFFMIENAKISIIKSFLLSCKGDYCPAQWQGFCEWHLCSVTLFCRWETPHCTLFSSDCLTLWWMSLSLQ